MTFPFRPLHTFISQSINPITLSQGNLRLADFEVWKFFFNTEIENLRLTMFDNLFNPGSEVDKKNTMSAVQNQIVILSDQLNHYLYRERKLWQTNTNANLIKNTYMYSLEQLEDFLKFAFLNFNQFYDFNIKATNFELRNMLPKLRSINSDIRQKLASANIKTDLIEIIFKGLNGLLALPI